MGEMINRGSSRHRDLLGRARASAWPSLPLTAWRDTRDTLHLWTQIVGKVRLALSPMTNHWWNVPLYVNSRGLTTTSIPYGNRLLEFQFDFVAHELAIQSSDGQRRIMILGPRTVKDFYEEFQGHLAALKIEVPIRAMPVEIPQAIPFDKDVVHRAYDAEYVHRFWSALVSVDKIFEQFRAPFVGKASPVHFFWGSFDLTTTRFSGRRAPPHGEVPHIPLRVVREAYSHEQSSVGFWTGGGGFEDAAFFAYVYPEPDGYPEADVPKPAFYSRELHEFVLPYEAVRTSTNPEKLVLSFAEATYDAAANLSHWNRVALERGQDGEIAKTSRP